MKTTFTRELIWTNIFFIKIKRIGKKGRELDERMQHIIYRALSIGFYFLLGTVLWYYSKEISLTGELSTRTYAELIAAFSGYVGSYFILQRKL